MPQSNSGQQNMESFFTAIRELEAERNSRIWCMLNDARRHMCYDIMWKLYADRNPSTQGETLEILVHSPGGHPDLAYRMMKFFRRRFRKVNILVPLQAKSAATLICLGADKIFMGELADLGPIDVQIDDQVKHGGKGFSPLDEFKSIEYMRDQAIEWMDYYAKVMNRQYGLSIKEALKDSIPLVTDLMQPVFSQIDPIEMGANRRALAISEEYASRMLALVDHDDPRALIKQLVWGYPSHDFCIDFEEAKQIGLPVERLSAEQDRKLSEVVFQLERDIFYGFAPTPPSPPQRAAPAAPVPARARRPHQNRPAPRGNAQRANGRTNGRNGAGTEERV